ncbi:tRNA 2-thiocytidine(32) synthetase TtcA [Synergistales bacterium]|nr:tRNA 2-thiocytidine(32) synthetase TtcA [Synergistales bacterium]
MGRAVSDFSMIRDGDSVMVGMSGGKDSAFLLRSLCMLRDRSPIKFTVEAFTVDPTDGGRDMSPLAEFAASFGVPHTSTRYPIFEILEQSKTPSPCSLCANIRRGILASRAAERGFTSLALGHHKDDAIETAFLNLMYEGRFRSFHPNTFMSRTGIRVIRPLVYVTEADIVSAAERLSFPIINFCCGYEASSMRAYVKATMRRMRRKAPDMNSSVISALKSLNDGDAWQVSEKRRGDKQALIN